MVDPDTRLQMSSCPVMQLSTSQLSLECRKRNRPIRVSLNPAHLQDTGKAPVACYNPVCHIVRRSKHAKK
ncbi:hypothetical protein BABINDRAFT_159192 [Babjeviella inositovora NRRL Y-12698]|uniref:Uncharacterized protein n=1 Tax=Babjeviella inositovora NRRL Y-12698 TaxID=984486 RepID=A0A1E3QYA6_9ASCO|nr:uncharacterized protein BABINDRAFT_159192 [Babjeviella inositovora NRRL Y-12698]ODQ82650.1 hypothetical protein BABINDRAFT_159192 [Babjeviella inositovora NRRL Y-12698]